MSRRFHRHGFSLLEVMLATVILLGAIVVLGELARVGSRNVQAACAETQAERIAQSVLSRVVAEGREPELVRDAAILESPGWLYSIEVAPLDRPALSAVRVTVSQDLPEEKLPVRFTVIRWLRSPAEDIDGVSGDAMEPRSTEPVFERPVPGREP
jgi:prepilin-type N-terminal cleavage/methylation domain-containing protein